jgi:hypothetical protein
MHPFTLTIRPIGLLFVGEGSFPRDVVGEIASKMVVAKRERDAKALEPQKAVVLRKGNVPESHRVKFTQLAVERLLPPEEGRIIYWDTLLPGFGVRVSAPRCSGHVHKVWVADYRVCGKLVMETIGPTTLIVNVEDARNLARASMLKARQGVNPVEERRGRLKAAAVALPTKNPALLLPAVVYRYMSEFRTGRGRNGKPRRSSSVERVEYCLYPLLEYQPTKFVNDIEIIDGDPWKLRYVDELNRDEVKIYIKKIGDAGHEIQSNRSLQAIKAMFSWALEEHLITINPIADLKPLYAEKSRNRWLSDPEIRAFWWACDEIGYPYGPICQILLLTACRRNEVARMPSRGELNMEKRLWTLPSARTKTDQTHLVYLADLVMQIFNQASEIL